MGLKIIAASAALATALSCASVTHAQEDSSGPAVGTDLFYSTDSDETTVMRAAINLDLRNDGAAQRIGVRLENAWYEPFGSETEQRQRIFIQAGDVTGAWTWSARVGTDGDNIIGSASAFDNATYRKEFFIERDVVETPLGLERGIYSTFAGAAVDIPLDDRNVLTALAGLQEFTGDNERLHLRGNYIHVLKPELGLSAQLRGQYFHSTEPNELDYFSPRDFVQVLPVLQMRRFAGDWRLLALGGIGLQKSTGSQWKQANYAELSAQSPIGANWTAGAELIYTNLPGASATVGSEYSYLQTRINIQRRF